MLRTWQHFNEHNQVDESAWQTPGGTYSETYEYDEDDGSLKTVTGSDSHAQELTYDSLSRLSRRELKKDGSSFLMESYAYRDIDDTKTTTQVEQKSIQGGSAGYTFDYPEYDSNGNILKETTTRGTAANTTTYVYDDQNQLTRENNQAAGKTWVWTYDSVGNILSRKEYAYTTETPGTALDTVNYGYTDTQWQDLLTNYDGKPITYDGSGNITSIGRSGTDYYRTFAWENGRQLESLNHHGTQVSFTYDGSGLRTGKTVTSGGATQTYSYIYNGDKLVEMTATGTNAGTLRFTYDTNGHPATVTYGGNTYYYVTNLQGDVIAILDGSRNSVVEYTYNAWGQMMSVTGTKASDLGQLNPLRYRGYVYDTETALYYLQSRYYDPEVGRFINADSFASTGLGVLGYNMFAYCDNNPVSLFDPEGTIPFYDHPFTTDIESFFQWYWETDQNEVSLSAKLKKSINSFCNNLELTAGVGVGVGKETELLGKGGDFSARYDVVAIQYCDNEWGWGDRFAMSMSISVTQALEIGIGGIDCFRKNRVDPDTNSWIVVNDTIESWTLFSYADYTYFLGGNIEIGFDLNTFLPEVSAIWEE